MTDLEKHLLGAAKTHPEYDEKSSIAELDLLNNLDSDLINHLWVLHKKGKIGNQNVWNSCLAYYLRITSQKPNGTCNLVKRRTYGRAGFPDIDMDFADDRRHEVVEYIIEKYGREYVGNIGTVQTLKTKAAIRRAVKVLDPSNSVRFDSSGNQIKSKTNESFALENEILNSLPDIMKRGDGTEIGSVDEAYEEYPEFARYMDRYPEVRRIASGIEGMIAGSGMHAAGLVISPIPLSRIAPLHVTTEKGAAEEDESPKKLFATQFSMADIERMGLIKFDILGVSTRTAIDLAKKLIKEGHGVVIDWNKIPLDDEKALKLLNSGKTDGVFQCEEGGMKECLRQIGIDSFEDLIVAIAMFRPGPKDYIPDFAGRKRGTIGVAYPHEKFREITESTYSIMVFQEQVMQIFMALADLTATDGYSFMKGCAKKKSDLIASYESKFLKGCASQGVSASVAERIFFDMKKFGGYAFNRSHSCSYAYESYKTAYLKANYTTEFMAARLSVETTRRKFDQVAKYEKDAKNFGIEILEPTLNESKLIWSIVGENKLRKPLLVKGVGIKAAQEIIDNQPYKGKDMLYAFAIKVGSAVTSKVMEAMKDAGFWSGISKERLVKDFEQIKKDKKRSRGCPDIDIFA